MGYNIYIGLKPTGCFSATLPYALLIWWRGRRSGLRTRAARGLNGPRAGPLTHARSPGTRSRIDIEWSFIHSIGPLMHCIIFALCMYVCILF